MLKRSKDLRSIPQLKNSVSYLYIEHANIDQENWSVSFTSDLGRTPIPIAGTTCLLLGPGTTITHAAIKTIAECGCMIIWCGEKMRKYYAVGSGETRSSKNILHQAMLLSNEQTHLEVVKNMYEIRFPQMPQGDYSLKQLRGMEGIRVKQAYKTMSKTYGVPWHGRKYRIEDIEKSDTVNRALTIANDLLYSICHSAIVSLGYSPALGFIHTGHSESFVYDVADFYKTAISIPAAFEAAAGNPPNLDEIVRRYCRKRFKTSRLLARIAEDISAVLDISINEVQGEGIWDIDAVIEQSHNYSTENDSDFNG